MFDRAATPQLTPAHPPVPSRVRLRYLPALDGLRALAVLAVLLYHADIAWAPGGFLGVDVFFVLSGYLITALLLAEWNLHGSIDLPRFWQRRARRLLPAVFLLIAVTLAFAVVWLPEEVARLRGDALAALAYIENWHLIFTQVSYFERSGRPSLFQHLWSLAIEEQFYLLWPPVLVMLLRRWGRRGALLAALLGAGLSAAFMALGYTPDEDPSRVYYGTDTRVFAVLIGAALASARWTARTNGQRRMAALPDVVTFAALAGLGAAVYFLDEYQPLLYRGGFIGVAVLAAALIAALTHPRARIGRLLLGNTPMRWVGTRSYAIYLWHWPLFMVTRPRLDVALEGWPLLVLRLAATVALAELSYRCVESPIRGGALGRAWQALRAVDGARRWWLRVQWAGVSGFGVILATLLGVAVVEARPPAPPAELAVEAVRDTPVSVTATRVATPEAPSAAAPVPTATPVVQPIAVHGQAFELPEYRVPSVPPRSPTPVPPSAAAEARAAPPPQPTAAPPPPAPPTEAPPIVSEAQLLPETALAPEAAPAEARPSERPAEPPPAEPPPAEKPPEPPAEPPTAETPPEPAPTEAPPPAPAASVTALGDSVMVGASRQMRDTIANLSIDAAVSRQAKTAIALLLGKREAGQLGEVVVVHMGTNGPFSARQFDEMMQSLAEVRRVVFVNVKVPRRWEGPNNMVIAEGVARYGNTRLVDWYAATVEHPELFARDGVHPQRAGARLYAEMIAAAITAP